MKKKPTTTRTRKSDVPYSTASKKGTTAFWAGATPHKGVAEYRAARGRPVLDDASRKQQIALRVDKEVLEWYRAQGAGWQTRMNAVLKAYRDATI